VFYHVDHLGTPRVITDEWGSVISRHGFFPFGEEVPGPWPIEASTNTHWFTGSDHDTECGSEYLLARSYNHRWARFGQADNIQTNQVIGRLNVPLYAYAGSSPLMYGDSTGLTVECRVRPVKGGPLLANKDH
jgi:RHS repeat-associated protein